MKTPLKALIAAGLALGLSLGPAGPATAAWIGGCPWFKPTYRLTVVDSGATGAFYKMHDWDFGNLHRHLHRNPRTLGHIDKCRSSTGKYSIRIETDWSRTR